MPIRISGINLPDQKRIVIALTAIFGVGDSTAKKVLLNLGIDENAKTKELTEGEAQKLRDYIENNIKIEGELRRETAMNIKRYKDINSYIGSRHAKGLPVRGQRTKTNSRTVRGNVRHTAGSGRKTSDEKT